MRFTLDQYASQGEAAALAQARGDSNAAAAHIQWAIHALKLEHEPDRILGRAAYDRAYKQTMRKVA